MVNAFDIIIHKGTHGEIYNIGTSFEISNIELARKLLEKYDLKDREEEYIQFYEDRPFNDCCYSIDTTKLNQLGWQPRVSFDAGLTKTSK